MSASETGLEPIILSIDLDTTPAEAYRRFTEGFGDWWPVLTHSLSRDASTRCALEARPGGRLYEVAPDGVEHLWGRVAEASTGSRLRFSWYPGREADSAQWVEVAFERAGQGCRATLTHGGWESLGEIAPLLRREYVPGWQHVFGELFARFAAPHS
jgi:uncharacterized protein YndB with AHSA1/START domain